MKNDDTPETRQRRYYQRNRDRILRLRRQKRKQKEQSESQKEKLAKSNGSFVLSNLASHLTQLGEQLIDEKLLIAILICICTGFLIWQSSETLEATEGHGALFKAVVCEIVLVTVSILQPSRFLFKSLKFFVLLVLCILTLLNALGGPLSGYSEGHSRVVAKQEEIAILRHSIAEKRNILSRYLATERISGAKRIESEISTLTDRLANLEREKGEGKPEVILVMGFAIAVLLRVSILMANILYSNRFGELVRNPTKNVKPFQKLVLVHG